MIAAGAAAPLPPPDEDALLLIGYTSGTTGFPKGAELTHRSVAHLGRTNQMSCRYAIGSVQVFGLSMSFTATVPAHLLPHLAVGGTSVLLPAWDTERLVTEIERHRATFVILPSPPIREFADLAERAPSRVASLVSVLHSASKAPPADLRRLVDVLGPRLVEGWGMTENSGGLLTATTERDYLERGEKVFDEAGRAVPGTLVRVVDEVGDVLPSDGETIGQLVARSPAAARGYWNNPTATEATFGGGWLRTGDLGTIDPDGYVRIVDRRHDLIVSGGMNVYPSEIERVLATAPGVAQNAVVPVPHPRWGRARWRSSCRRSPGHSIPRRSSPTAASGWPPTSCRRWWWPARSCRTAPRASCSAPSWPRWPGRRWPAGRRSHPLRLLLPSVPIGVQQIPQLGGEPGRNPSDGLADHLNPADHGALHVHVPVETLPTELHGTSDQIRGLDGVAHPFVVGPHTGTASASTLSRTRSFNPATVTTWVNTPRRSWTSKAKAPNANSPRPGATSTSRSRSLESSASPRATEPNTRMWLIPFAAAAAYSSSLHRRTSSSDTRRRGSASS